MEDGWMRFACPFFSREPASVSAKCSKGFPDIKSLKDHLKQMHFERYSCQRCFKTFVSEDDMNSHLRDATPCALKQRQLISWYSIWQNEEISRVLRKKDEEEKWKGIYRIIFGVRPEDIPSPYVPADSSRPGPRNRRASQYRNPLENIPESGGSTGAYQSNPHGYGAAEGAHRASSQAAHASTSGTYRNTPGSGSGSGSASNANPLSMRYGLSTVTADEYPHGSQLPTAAPFPDYQRDTVPGSGQLRPSLPAGGGADPQMLSTGVGMPNAMYGYPPAAAPTMNPGASDGGRHRHQRSRRPGPSATADPSDDARNARSHDRTREYPSHPSAGMMPRSPMDSQMSYAPIASAYPSDDYNTDRYNEANAGGAYYVDSDYDALNPPNPFASQYRRG